MNKGIILTTIIFTSIISMLLISSGITGMVISDENVSTVCEQDSDCSSGDVCCLFYHENGGVCSKQEFCQDIAILTAQKETGAYPGMTTSDKEAMNFAFGILLALGTAILIYGYVTSSKEDIQKNAGKA